MDTVKKSPLRINERVFFIFSLQVTVSEINLLLNRRFRQFLSDDLDKSRPLLIPVAV